MLFQKFLISNQKKICIDKGSEFYNKSIKSWFGKNYVEMHLVHNNGKSVVAEKFIRTLKDKIYKFITSISKNVYIGKLDVIVNKYNNTYHRTIKTKPFDVKSITYIDSSKEIVIKKVKNTVPWTYVSSDLNGEEIAKTFYKKELQKTNQKEFRVEKVIKRKGDKLYVQWKRYDNYFNSWIDKKR